MLKTITIIVLSVTLLGVIFFLYIKKILRKQLDFYLDQEKKLKSKGKKSS
jgi:hypothetical protein